MLSSELSEQINNIALEASKDFSSAKNLQALYDLKVKFLGKKGELSSFLKNIGQAPPQDRPQLGNLINQIKITLEESYKQKEDFLKKEELDIKLNEESLDLSLNWTLKLKGGLHPLYIVIHEIVDIFSRLGYSVRTGPQIEKETYNFEALNMPKDHPARDMQDSFYINDDYVLRTHTSPVQIHTMMEEQPPLRILAPGSVFRRDDDISHSPNFNQIEGLLIDRKVSMSDLKGTISYFAKNFFGPHTKIRFRPSFFPFTEPSAEVDCSCPLCRGFGCRMCNQSGWVEIAGCGLVHPKVLNFAGVHYPEWRGFAFGFGIERMTIIKYGIDDIRLFYENDIRFLRQF